jgi:hypothetical protein
LDNVGWSNIQAPYVAKGIFRGNGDYLSYIERAMAGWSTWNSLVDEEEKNITSDWL